MMEEAQLSRIGGRNGPIHERAVQLCTHPRAVIEVLEPFTSCAGLFNGRSYTMELLAVAAAEDVMGEDMLRAFRIALDKIRNYRSLSVIFERFYKKDEVPQKLKDSRPLLLDPSNPWNNLISPDRVQFFESLARFAEETLGTRNMPEVQQPQILLQSKGLHVESLHLIVHVLALWLITHKPQPASVQACLEKAVDAVMYGQERSWSPSSDPWESRDAIAVIPLLDGCGTCACAGFDVETNPHRTVEHILSLASIWP